jgi:hypothetical protein
LNVINQGRPIAPYLSPQQVLPREQDRPGSTSVEHRPANGIQEVDGSIPFGSTKQEEFEPAADGRRFFFMK